MMARSSLMGLGMLGAVLIAAPAAAQAADAESEATATDAPEQDKGGDGGGDDVEAKDDAREDEKAEAGAAGDADSSPVELKGETYRFVGARYRLIVVPKFIIGLFADGGKTVAVHSFGPEFAIRKDNFEYNFGLWYAAYSMDPTPFKATDDGEDAWELVESNIKVLYLTADFLWSHDFSPQVALNYGMGAGIGLVFGPLYRNQAYRAANGEYERCLGVQNPPGIYCGGDNDHYNNYEEPSWADGGSKPVIFPWLAAQTGLRYKPHKKFVGRLDAGFGLSGFFIGLGADYGL